MTKETNGFQTPDHNVTDIYGNNAKAISDKLVSVGIFRRVDDL
jgi:hypothetical protein